MKNSSRTEVQSTENTPHSKHTHKCALTYTRTRTLTHTSKLSLSHSHTHEHAHTHTDTYTCSHAHTLTYAHTHTLTQTLTHTHTATCMRCQRSDNPLRNTQLKRAGAERRSSARQSWTVTWKLAQKKRKMRTAFLKPQPPFPPLCFAKQIKADRFARSVLLSLSLSLKIY